MDRDKLGFNNSKKREQKLLGAFEQSDESNDFAKRDDTPMPGQIDISEILFSNSDDKKDNTSDERQDFGTIENQLGFENLGYIREEDMKKKDDKKELLNKMTRSSGGSSTNAREQSLLEKVSRQGSKEVLEKSKTTKTLPHARPSRVGVKVSSEEKSNKTNNEKKLDRTRSSSEKNLSSTKVKSRESALKKSANGTIQEASKSVSITVHKGSKNLLDNSVLDKEANRIGNGKGKNSTKNEPINKIEAKSVKDNQTKVKEIKSVDEEFDIDEFLDNNELKTRSEVESLNRDFEEVKTVVGRDVFSGIRNVKKTDVEKVYVDSQPEEIVDGMLYKNLDTVLHESMIPYSEHVILDRALPRVEDGLKPVQRRILYDMYELGNTPDKPFKKSARIVGDCLGKYHPHGDSSVYDAMVRMAQPFNCNEVLVSGHGNFGSVDGDDAAAMRYTEARLSPLAMELLRDIDKNTVRWGLNFDDTLKEPEMLPGRFPNLLVNGATGIAVGLATNIPPHNLGETIDGVVAYIDNPKITLKEMLKIIKGPDFPTGGYVLSSSELYEAYNTGRGKLYLRAKMHIEDGNDGKKSIVITELPYQVNKAVLLQKIVSLKEEEKYNLSGIQEVRDESDREGIRAVIKLKKDASVKKIYNSLLKNTDLQGTFGVNMVAIANGKPKQMGLLDIISYYAEYQREVVLRRTKYDLEQAQERAHILQGLIIAIKNIDAVVKIIKTSENTTVAKTRLKDKFFLSDKQAQAILDMRLARLTSLEVYKLEQELKELERLIKKYTEIVNSTKKQFDVVKSEMLDIKKKYAEKRKTGYLKESSELKIEEEQEKVVVAKDLYLLKTSEENLKVVSVKNYEQANRSITDESSPSDLITLRFPATNLVNLLAFTNFGNVHKAKMSALNETKYKDEGVSDWTLFKGLSKNEHIVAIFDEDKMKEDGNLMFYTKFGMIKKTEKKEYTLLKSSYQGIKLKDGDELLSVEYEKPSYNLVFVTRQGFVLNAKSDNIPLQGRVAGGVKGIMLSTNDYCTSVSSTVSNEGEIVIVNTNGLTKRVVVASIDESARYRKGVKVSTDDVAFSSVVTDTRTICVYDSMNNMYHRSSDLIRILPRTDRGKPFEKTKKLLLVKAVYSCIT